VRSDVLRRLADEEFDVLVIGGGINGAVAAAALSGHGVSVALVEKYDFASGVSSQSSNLAWGGIKYMESFEFGLVRKLCKCRNRLAQLYPSTVREVRFLTIIRRDFRWPAILVYLGSVLYWLLGSRKTQPPKYMSKTAIRNLEPLLDLTHVSAGFEYSDCHFNDNDARFVFNMIRTAGSHGAATANYTSVVSAKRVAGLWKIDARNETTGEAFGMRAKVLINACGPYVDEVNTLIQQPTKYRHVLSKGVHLVVDRLSSLKRVLTLFASDGRLFFIIPMGNKACVGTTDSEVNNPNVAVTDEDRAFILKNVNAGLAIDPPLTMEDVIAERCGARPLAVSTGQTSSADSDEGSDWLQLSRKHALDVDPECAHISIFGGKLTDCLNVGDAIVEQVAQLGVKTTVSDSYWCGEPTENERLRFMKAAQSVNLDNSSPGSDRADCDRPSERLWRQYGTKAFELVQRIEQDADQKVPVLNCSSILRCEIEYARDKEMVITLEDFLRRRTRLAQLIRPDELMADPGMKRLCELLFPPSQKEKLNPKKVEKMVGVERFELPTL